jgi:hypothetical protein
MLSALSPRKSVRSIVPTPGMDWRMTISPISGRVSRTTPSREFEVCAMSGPEERAAMKAEAR